jgi:hypothetical protein
LYGRKKITVEDPLDILKKVFFAINPLSEQEWQDFASVWQTVHYKRKTALTTAGETERSKAFALFPGNAYRQYPVTYVAPATVAVNG